MPADVHKADQIAHRFFAKFALIIDNARTPANGVVPAAAKVDKWFNLETPDTDTYKEHLRAYRSISTLSAPPPPLELHILLSIPELAAKQVLVLNDPPASRVRVDPTPSHILLESWRLAFAPATPSAAAGEVTLATVYKHGMSLFRSLFTLLRVLPAWRLCRRLRRRGEGGLSIEVRIADSDPNTLTFGTPLSTSTQPLPTSTHEFPPISHPYGALSLSVTYITRPSFHIDTLESLLSSRFLSLDHDASPALAFTPTLARTPGSLPVRAEHFVLPPTGSRTSLQQSPQSFQAFPSINTSPRSRNIALPTPSLMPRPPSPSNVSGSGDSASRLSQESQSRDQGQGVSLAARVRRESGGANIGADLPSAPSAPLPLPIRRPSINAVHPFKSSTLSSGSPSFHSTSRHSPLSSGHSAQASRLSLPQQQASPIGTGVGTRPAIPATPLRASPPGPGPSSLSDRRGSETSSSPALVPRSKRYSSSFGHRYATSGGAGSDGSAGSGSAGVEREKEREASVGERRERKDSERAVGGNASYMSINADDTDISTFMQDIDERKPLSGFGVQGPGQSHDRVRAEDEPGDQAETIDRRERTDGGTPFKDITGTDNNSGRNPGPSVALTSQGTVDARLKQLNEVFRASLVGMISLRTGSGNGNAPRSAAGRRDSRGSGSEERPATRDAPRVGRRAATVSSATPIGTVSHPRARSGIELARRAATMTSVESIRRGSGSGSAVGSGSGSGSSSGVGSGYGRPRRNSTAGSAGSEEVMGRLEM